MDKIKVIARTLYGVFLICTLGVYWAIKIRLGGDI